MTQAESGCPQAVIITASLSHSLTHPNQYTHPHHTRTEYNKVPPKPVTMVFSASKACLFLVVSAVLTDQALAVGMKKTLLSLYQDPPTLVTGNYSSFVFATYDAVLRSSKGGPIVGMLYGTTTVNTELDDALSLDVRDRHLTFDFGPKGQITAAGIVSYPADSAFLHINDPTTMAVTGGTFDYFGATGQVTSQRLDVMGAHTQTFQMYCFKKRGGFRQKTPKSP